MNEYEKLVARLQNFVSELDKIIDSKSECTHAGVYQTVSNESYCLALERTKKAVENILLNKDCVEE